MIAREFTEEVRLVAGERGSQRLRGRFVNSELIVSDSCLTDHIVFGLLRIVTVVRDDGRRYLVQQVDRCRESHLVRLLLEGIS